MLFTVRFDGILYAFPSKTDIPRVKPQPEAFFDERPCLTMIQEVHFFCNYSLNYTIIIIIYGKCISTVGKNSLHVILGGTSCFPSRSEARSVLKFRQKTILLIVRKVSVCVGRRFVEKLSL